MKVDNDGGPAFPSHAKAVEKPGYTQYELRAEGLSIRDYFAGQALMGDLAGKEAGAASDEDAEFIAMRAYDFADAMLVERSKRSKAANAVREEPESPVVTIREK